MSHTGRGTGIELGDQDKIDITSDQTDAPESTDIPKQKPKLADMTKGVNEAKRPSSTYSRVGFTSLWQYCSKHCELVYNLFR